MKRQSLRNITILIVVALIGVIIANATITEADEVIEQADEFIATRENTSNTLNALEPETVSLSYSEWQQAEMDVWEMGAYYYGISELDTTRTLKLISYEGYGYSPLSYYVACCCWVRATEGYWGYDNLYQAFGEADTSYDEWMDEIEIADWAYEYLELCYKDPSYCRYCNGMMVPDAWMYEEGGIYAW